jgi:AraC-like DNA-binding protein
MPDKRKKKPEELVREVIKIVFSCKIEDYKHINVNWLARELGVHVSHLSRVFFQETQTKLSVFLIDCKMSQAIDLLFEHRELRIKEIAEMLDYTPSYFTKVFKKYNFGESPWKCRNVGRNRYEIMRYEHLDARRKK